MPPCRQVITSACLHVLASVWYMVRTGEYGRRGRGGRMIVAFVNGKGGSGKSTLAVHAAAWLTDRGKRVAFIDADAQETSSEWLTEAAPDVPVIRAHSIGAIVRAAEDLRHSADVVIGDGPAGLDDQTLALAGVANRVVIPCCPSVADLRGADRAAELIRRVQGKRNGAPSAVLVLNRMRRTRLSRGVVEAAPTLGLRVAKCTIGLRDAYADAAGQGSTVFRMGYGARTAAAELSDVFREVLKGV